MESLRRNGERVQPLYGTYADRAATVVETDRSGNVKLDFDEPPEGWPNRVWFGWREIVAAASRDSRRTEETS